MGKPCSTDLRQRVVASAFEGGASRRKAATRITATVVVRQAPLSVKSLMRRITCLLRVENSLFRPKKFPVISTVSQCIGLTQVYENKRSCPQSRAENAVFSPFFPPNREKHGSMMISGRIHAVIAGEGAYDARLKGFGASPASRLSSVRTYQSTNWMTPLSWTVE